MPISRKKSSKTFLESRQETWPKKADNEKTEGATELGTITFFKQKILRKHTHAMS